LDRESEKGVKKMKNLTRMLGMLLLVPILVDSAYSVDLKGKFGIGPRWWGAPLVALGTTRYGLTSKFSVEPFAGYYKWTDEHEYSSGSTRKDKYSMLLFAALGNYSVASNAKGNVYIRAGGILATGKNSSEGPYDSSSGTISSKGVLVGYGLEHFVSNHFAINVGMLSGFWIYEDDCVSNGRSYGDSFTGLLLGNQLFDFTLMWYY
jgi:hypothetical protein